MTLRKQMRCIAIDDEPIALRVIERFAEKVPFLELVGTYQNPLEAIEVLQGNPVDLIFLDVEMPDLNGMQFLQSLQDPPMVIFTTAYSKYAVESYEMDAVDYLLKPIEFDRFLKAVNKANRLMHDDQDTASQAQESTQENTSGPYLFLKSDTRIFKVDRNDIRFIEGMRDYIAVHVSDSKKILTLMSLSKMLEKLPDSDFIRIHKSYIINIHHIALIQHNRVTIGGKEIPISNTYRDAFYALIEKMQ